MARRSYIATLLLVLYSTLMILPALTTLSCPCLSQRTSNHKVGCCCCHSVDSDHLLPQGSATISKGCQCLHSHDTEVELYTFNPSNDNLRSTLKVVSTILFDAILCAEPESDFSVALFDYCRLRSERLKQLFCQGVKPLRAPPVLV